MIYVLSLCCRHYRVVRMALMNSINKCAHSNLLNCINVNRNRWWHKNLRQRHALHTRLGRSMNAWMDKLKLCSAIHKCRKEIKCYAWINYALVNLHICKLLKTANILLRDGLTLTTANSLLSMFGRIFKHFGCWFSHNSMSILKQLIRHTCTKGWNGWNWE